MDNQQPRDMGETKKKRKTVGIETKHHWDMVIETTTLVQTTCWCVCYGVFFGGPRQHSRSSFQGSTLFTRTIKCF